MKKVIPLLICILCAGAAFARKDLVVVDATGHEIIHTISNDTRLHANGIQLELAEGESLVATLDGTQPLAIKLQKSSGIVSAQGQELSIVKTGASLQCVGLRQPAQMRIYSITGALCLQAQVEDGSSVGIGHLAPGMYIVKINDVATKIIL